mmetsp:Transcript_4407/g.6984  ORF Transcript_4407/g.6984 Transcript_4407/m.6984 type:complete len:126 (-) Transcript_4407:188-565(-)
MTSSTKNLASCTLNCDPHVANPSVLQHHFSQGPSAEWIKTNSPKHQPFLQTESSFPCTLSHNNQDLFPHLRQITCRKMVRAYLFRIRQDLLRNPPLYRSSSSLFHVQYPTTCAEIAYFNLKNRSH